MHEMSLCEGIRDVIEDQVRRHALTRVRRVRLEIGRFACVEKDALAFAFDVAMRGSPAEGAELEIIDLPGRALCYGCGGEVEIEDRFSPCPDCGAGPLMPSGGDEMRIRELEAV